MGKTEQGVLSCLCESHLVFLDIKFLPTKYRKWTKLSERSTLVKRPAIINPLKVQN